MKILQFNEKYYLLNKKLKNINNLNIIFIFV